MENLLLVAREVAVLFVLMGLGAALRRLRLVDDRGIDGMVNVLLLFVTPSLIIDCFQKPFDGHALGGLGVAIGISAMAHFAVIAASYLLVRHRSDDTCRPLRLAAVFSNAGFVGIPLQQAVIGDAGVFFGVGYIIVFNLFMWSWGLRTMQGGGAVSAVKMFVNPGTVGLFVGLPLFLLSVRLPAVVGVPLHHLANLNTPLAMIVVGYSLAGAKLGCVARLPMAYVAAFVRLVGYPMLLIAAMYPFRHLLDREVMLSMTVAASAPAAVMVSMFAVKFRRDVDASVAVVCGTTLLSVFTMPAVIATAMTLL